MGEATRDLNDDKLGQIPQTEGRLRVVHVVRSLDPAAGGVPVIALKIAVAQAADGHDVGMLVYQVPGRQADVAKLIDSVPGGQRVRLHEIPAETRWERLTGFAAGRVAGRLAESPCVFHLHGIWEPMLQRTAAAARHARRVHVVTPHGMLDPWSLGQSRWKKRLAMTLGVRKMLNHASFLHLGNVDERQLIAPLGLTSPTELIPNGVFEHEVLQLPPAGTFRAAFPALGDAPFILFLSRLHYKKGLDLLADAFARVAPQWPALKLVVAGPEDGAGGEFRRQIDAAGLSGRVILTGPLYGEPKMAALHDAAVFCLPSRQEGFSMAITEALGVGVPCVVTRACHYPEVEQSGAGYCTDLSGEAVAAGLIKVLRLTPAERQTMGQRGRTLVLSRFTWPVIARRTVELYRKYGA